MTSTSNPLEAIRILSLNCWGLKYVAKHRQQRITAIADHLSTTEYDIIGLQELWMYSDFQRIREAVKHTLPEAKFWASGSLGSGLAIFSRWPVISTSIHPYALNGSPLDVLGGDYFVGKSIVSIVIDHPTLGEVEVFNTHMYARGGDTGEEWNRAHRLVGAWQFANLTRHSALLGRYVIATGDFNSIPTSVVINIIQSHAGLTDAWAASHDSSLFPPGTIHTPQHAIHNYGVTCDSPLNFYSANKTLDETARRCQGKRLDYIFYRKPHAPPTSLDPSAISDRPELFCSDSKVVFTSLVPGFNISYSDHFGVEATLDIRPHHQPLQDSHSGHNSNGVISSGSSTRSGIPLGTFTSGGQHLSRKTLGVTLDALATAHAQAVKASNVQIAASMMMLFGAIGLVVGSAWSTDSIFNPLITLLAVVLGGASTTMFYAGFIYGKYEVNMFSNVAEELELLHSQRSRRHSGSDQH